MGHFVDIEVGLEFKQVILQHCTGNILIGDFHQVYCRLYVIGGDSRVRCEDIGSAIDGNQIAVFGGNDGCSRNIGQCTGQRSRATLSALAALILASLRGSLLSVVSFLDSFPCQASTR